MPPVVWSFISSQSGVKRQPRTFASTQGKRMPPTNTPASGPETALVILRMTWKMLPNRPMRSPSPTAITPVKEATREEDMRELAEPVCSIPSAVGNAPNGYA